MGNLSDEINNLAENSMIDEIDDDLSLLPEIIRINNISKDYDLEDYIVRAVDSVSLDILRGDFVAIQGPSGAGKTTLISMISGLDKPTSGEIKIEWVSITDFEEETMATFRVLNIGFVFQNYNLISSLTAEENIMFPMSLAGVDYNLQKQMTKRLLERVHLPEREEHLPFQLSAGEQQRVGIARALANDPPIILADEPTANLDKKSSDIIAELFKEMSNEGKTIVVVTHDDRLLQHAHRIITFEDSKIVKDERIKEPSKIDFSSKTMVVIPENIKDKIRITKRKKFQKYIEESELDKGED